ncbi:MAG: hypothetical protein JWM11_5171 [Planctomycetaceae bacterium]|nr:hypothetical protein [Planctomycetaceae bacterium]
MDICEKIDAFENHIFIRQLRIAQVLGERFCENNPIDPLAESAFAIVSICFSYFEMIEQFCRGQSSDGQSWDFFKRGFERVFPSFVIASADVKQLYKTMRCGMYHTAMPTDRYRLSRELSASFKKVNGLIEINPVRLTDEIIYHFNRYCHDLRSGNDSALQQSFEMMFDSLTAGAKSVTDVESGGTPAPGNKDRDYREVLTSGSTRLMCGESFLGQFLRLTFRRSWYWIPSASSCDS